MLEDARHGLINLILVKDLSRLGRDFVEVGRYTDVIFPSLGCRFVSVLDCLDTEGDNTDMLHFRSLMNDYHLKDLSGKIKSVLHAKMRSGQYIAAYAPYGYRRMLISWCVGHLVSPMDAGGYNERFKKWRYDDLPILPEPFRYVLAPGKEDTFENLRALMDRPDVDTIVNACDAGREGELIFRLVYEMTGCRKPVLRLWISSMEDSAIREGFSDLRPGTDYEALYQSALCRQKADWLVGINATHVSIRQPGMIHIIQFPYWMGSDQRLKYTEMILAQVWNEQICPCMASKPVIFVLDEAHGLHLASQNMSTRILREGRKFGISGWFITQWADDIKMLNTLSQAALRIFFRPGTENIKSLAKALAHGNLKSALQYRQMIAGMRVGDFFFFNTSGNAVYVKNTDTNQIQEGGNYNGL